MPDVDLLLSLAEIAGVFVGFGALIAVRRGRPREAHEFVPVRAVLIMGVATIIAALAPVTIGRYDLADRQVLALSSIVVLAAYVGLGYYHFRAPEFKAAAAVFAVPRSRASAVIESIAYVLVVGGPLVALLAIALGLAPGLDAALYFTVVVLFLVQATWTLLLLAFMDRDREESTRG